MLKYIFHCKNTSILSNETAAHNKSRFFKWTKKSDYISYIESLFWSYYVSPNITSLHLYSCANPNAWVGKSTVVGTEILNCQSIETTCVYQWVKKGKRDFQTTSAFKMKTILKEKKMWYIQRNAMQHSKRIVCHGQHHWIRWHCENPKEPKPQCEHMYKIFP